MSCPPSECILWYDFFSETWVIASDCGEGCSCPIGVLGDMPVPQPLFGNVSPAAILSCISIVPDSGISSGGAQSIDMFMPLTVARDTKDEARTLRRTGFGTICFDAEWMRDKQYANCKYIGAELQRKRRGQPCSRSLYSVNKYNSAYFPKTTELNNDLEVEVNGFIFGGIDDAEKPTPNPQFSAPRIAGSGCFVEFDLDVRGIREIGSENAAQLIPPLFAVERDAKGNKTCVRSGTEIAPVCAAKALEKMVEKAEQDA